MKVQIPCHILLPHARRQSTIGDERRGIEVIQVGSRLPLPFPFLCLLGACPSFPGSGSRRGLRGDCSFDDRSDRELDSGRPRSRKKPVPVIPTANTPPRASNAFHLVG